ncbi:MAG: CotH kinase family protein [Bacteroidia bacterium]|nr:CotH kinase family protein [Bacteroidia bacterium]
MFRIVLSVLLLLCFHRNSKSAILSGPVTSNTTLNGKVDINADVVVAANITLTFSAGSTLSFGEGVSILSGASSNVLFEGTPLQPIIIKSSIPGVLWGKIEAKGINSIVDMQHVKMQGGYLKIVSGASAILESSYFSDYYNGPVPIILTEDAADIQMRNCIVSNYYEVNFIRSKAVIEDCIFQFMTADGIDFDNSPAGTILRRSTLRYGKGTNIDAVDFGKIDFMGPGSLGLVQQCIIHDISDKGISIGEGAQEVNVEGNLFYNCGAGVSVKDNSVGRVYNNTFVYNRYGLEAVEKNPGLGGGHAYTFNNIFWDNDSSFYLNSSATLEVRYSDLHDRFPEPLNFNISEDPLFINPSAFDFRLRESSPAIGAGIGGATLGALFPAGTDVSNVMSLHLGIPNSFSEYAAGDTVQISWSASENLTTIKILFSEDDGVNWQTIATGINAQDLEKTWYAPMTYSTRCRIRIVSENNFAIQSENYLPFKIHPEINTGFSAMFSLPAGYYNSEQILSLSSQPGDVIYYSLDGSDPTDQSEVYANPIQLKFDSIPGGQTEQNITSTQGPKQPYAYIRTSPTSHIGPNPTFWYLPSGSIFKASVVKARIYRPGTGLGPVVTRSYFLDPDMLNHRYSLPVVSLVSDPDHLFDYYNGIYIPGADFTGYAFTGNYERKGRASEKPAHIEYFNTNGRLEFSKEVGFRVRGEWIRTAGQKALTVYARSEYDEQNEFDYELFPGLTKPGTNLKQDKFKRFILRNAGNEWGWTVNSMCRDMLTQSLFERLDVKYQAGKSTIVFLNGEYWGIHNIRELNDHRGLEFSYGVHPDSVIMMEDNLDGPFKLARGNDGDLQEYHNMRNFILNNDMSISSNYDSVKKLLDIENFADYWIATIYSNKKNTDHNTSYWKLRNGKPGQGQREEFDGRWRWMANDFDNGLDLPASGNNLEGMIYWMKDSLLKRMINNPEFVGYFLNRFADLMNSSFSTSHVLKRLDYYYQILEPEMPEHIARWRTPSNMANWDQAMNNFRVFGQDRPFYQFEHLRTRFGITDNHQLEMDVNDRIMGIVQVNTLRIDPSLHGVHSTVYPWTGSYFENVPVTISALPYSGYRFVEWMETGETATTISLNLQTDTKRTALFELDPSQDLRHFQFYPNPVPGSKIHFYNASIVSIFNMEGKEVLRTDSPVLILDISTLASGIYTVRLNDGAGVKLVKL